MFAFFVNPCRFASPDGDELRVSQEIEGIDRVGESLKIADFGHAPLSLRDTAPALRGLLTVKRNL